MRHDWRRLAVGTVVLLVAGACTDSLSIDEVIGEWEAVSVNGTPVPGEVLIFVGDSTRTIPIEYDRFQFFEGGKCLSLLQYETARRTECEYRIDVERQTVTIEFPMIGPPFAFEIPGTFDGGQLTLRIPNRGGPPNVSVYQRRGDIPFGVRAPS